MIAIEEEKALKFQDGLKPYLKNKISILKLSVYLEVVDRALIAKKDNEELHQYREQQRKRNRNDGAHGNQAQKRFAPSRDQNKGKAAQNLDGICPTCLTVSCVHLDLLVFGSYLDIDPSNFILDQS